jgi:hypothetical protein
LEEFSGWAGGAGAAWRDESEQDLSHGNMGQANFI